MGVEREEAKVAAARAAARAVARAAEAKVVAVTVGGKVDVLRFMRCSRMGYGYGTGNGTPSWR